MTTTYLAPYLTQQFFTNNGQFNAGGFLWSYQAGTSIPATTYVDNTGTTTNTNPIVLNARGECSLWLPPNAAFKFVLEDAASNIIWTRDQASSSVQLTLFAGVDTGVANAYIVNFSANFTTLTNGIVLYFIPANSNTGPSTINVNGLGVISIVNQNGTALVANELLANQIATIMYLSGQWVLIQGAQQGLVSYGGTDTGTANNYIVALTNQYFAYQAGNVLFFIPNNTNTGASVINVKGLGNQSIFQAGGGALIAGQVIAGALTELVYTGTFFRLVSPTFAESSFVLTATGFVSNPTPTVNYWVSGNQVTLEFPIISGTSNATTFTLTGFPNSLQGTTLGVASPLVPANDNSVGGLSASISIPNQVGGSTVTVTLNNTTGAWTNAGTKRLANFSFSYLLI
jgi:hypothetical protein